MLGVTSVWILKKRMSNLSIESTKEQQQSRDDSQIQSPKAKESKLESKQPTNTEFQLPGLLDLSILTLKHFQVFGKDGSGPGDGIHSTGNFII